MPTPDKKSSSPEENAVKWPPPDYRDWVQTQIASKMLVRLGGITVASAVVVVGAIITYVQVFEQRITERIIAEAANQAGERLEGQIPGAVATALLDQGNLVETTVEEAQGRLNELIPDLVQAEEFVEPASQAVLEAIINSGGSQRVILDEARERLFDANSDAATRALSLRIYVLFHPSVSGLQDIPPMQQTFVDLLDNADDSGYTMPVRLVDALLEHYPMGGRTGGDVVCVESTADCDGWDLQMLDFVLAYAGGDRFPDLTAANLRIFLRRLPPRLADYALDWATENLSSPLAGPLMAALVATENTETLALVVDRLSILVDERDPILQVRSLDALATLNPDAALPRDVRAQALRRIWASFEDAVLEEAFSSDALRHQMDLGRELFGDADLADLDAWALSGLVRSSPELVLTRDPEFFDDSDVVGPVRQSVVTDNRRRRIVLALLRAGDTGRQSGGLEEWTFVFEPAMGQRRVEPAWNALAMRISRDAAADQDVSELADQLLEATLNLQRGRLSQQTVAVALRHASRERFESVTSDYRNTIWRRSGVSDSSTVISAELFERQLRDLRDDLGWLATWLDSSSNGNADFDNHLLATFAAVHEMIPEQDRDTPPLRQALQTVAGLRLVHEGDLTALRTTLFQRLLDLAEQNHWEAAQLAEDSGVLVGLADDPVVPGSPQQVLRERFHWWDDPMAETATSVTLQAGGRDLLYLPAHPPNSGFWVLLNVESDNPFQLLGPSEGSIAVFNAARNEVVTRGPIGASLALTAGTYALHFRGLPEQVHLIRFEATDFLQTSTLSDPIALLPGEYVFNSATQEGELWLELDLREGESIELETYVAPDEFQTVGEGSNRTDTVIDFFNADGSAQILSNDDGGDGTFSLLRFTAETAGTHLVRLHRYFDQPFHPGTVFALKYSSNL